MDDVDSLKGMIRQVRKVIDGATLIKEKSVRGWYQGEESDVDGAEAVEEGICGDSGVLVPAIVSVAFEKIQDRTLGSKFLRDVGDSKRFRLPS